MENFQSKIVKIYSFSFYVMKLKFNLTNLKFG